MPAATVVQNGDKAAKEGEEKKPIDTLVPALGGTVFNIDRPQGGIVTVRITPPTEDVLATDNQAWLVVPPAKKLTVAIVTRGNLFIASALEELPLGKPPEVMSPEQFEQARAANKLNYDVVVLDGYLPQMPKDSPTPLPPGRWLIFGAIPPAPLGVVDKGADKGALPLEWNRDHPALRGVALDALQIAKIHEVEIPKGSAASSLMTTDVGPGIVELAIADSRSIAVMFDVTDSDWAFNVSFVLFMAQAVGYLGDDSSGLGQMVQPGGILTDRLPLDSKDARIKLPDQTNAEIGSPAADGKIVFGPVQRSGIYEVSWTGKTGPTDAEVGGRAVRPFAANLLDSAESDVATSERLELASKQVAADKAANVKVAKSLWPWLILGALAVILLEWFVYNRKVQL